MFSEVFDTLKTIDFLVFLFYVWSFLLFLYFLLWLLRFFVSLFIPRHRLSKASRSDNISDMYQDPWDIPDIDID